MPEKDTSSSKKIVGGAYNQPKRLVKKYAKKDIPLLFVGETGSGKELFARLYLEESKRPGDRRAVNCSAFSDELLRSEVFGHIKGAFTDAIDTRKGLVSKCDNGILFLDELGSASKEFQAVILRVAEGNSFSSIGSDEEKTCNTLIIAATSNLSNIRTDLQFRFNILPIPPLQNFDIPEITKHYLGKSLKEKYLDGLMNAEYPGNVRQLIKRCNKLLAEKGNEIFGERGSNRVVKTNSFDYYQFRNEVELWQKHIQPIIEKYRIVGIRYKYKASTISAGMSLRPGCNRLGPGEMDNLAYQLKKYGIPNRLEGIPDKDLLTTFGENLKIWIEKGELNELLDLFEHQEIAYNQPVAETSDKKPNISRIISGLIRILDIGPLKTAMKEFERLYMNYYLEKNAQNRKKVLQY